MTLFHAVQWAAVLCGLLSAALSVRAATVEVRNNLDEFMNDIRRQSRWATWSAVATSATAVLVVGQTLLAPQT